jgi:predicted SAM-dependent methyltransferase
LDIVRTVATDPADPHEAPGDEARIHIGCGRHRIAGWVNVDISHIRAVDVMSDVTNGLPIPSACSVFAEHFIEHLELDEVLRFLTDCRSVLVPSGVLRISTPNLDWVWATSYSSRWRQTSPSTAVVEPEEWTHDSAATADCLGLNLAFRGWGHRSLFHESTLEYSLHRAGFADLTWCRYGQSDHPELSGLERHPHDPDISGISDVLIVEASGRFDHQLDRDIEARLDEYQRDMAP